MHFIYLQTVTLLGHCCSKQFIKKSEAKPKPFWPLYTVVAIKELWVGTLREH